MGTSVELFKTAAALLLFAIALIGGLLPLRLQHAGSAVVSCLNMAAGGVFFSTAMVHMLPESSETLLDTWGDVFPWAGFLCAVGFLLILCIDQAVSIVNAGRRRGRKNGHTLLPTEMTGISPEALLSHPAMGPSQGLLAGLAGGGSTNNGSLDSILGDNELGVAPPCGVALANSHGLGDEGDGVCVRLALLLALSVHSVMEGLGVGAEATKAYNLLFAIGLHKGLAGYALGASLLQSGVRVRQVVFFIFLFSIMTPLGILIGAVIEKDAEGDSAGAVCVALAAGTFLYVSLMEVIPPELACCTETGWGKIVSLIAGFSIATYVGWLVG